jgi:hypothetical protein
VHVAIVDPYATEPLLGYGELRDALRAGDLETVSSHRFRRRLLPRLSRGPDAGGVADARPRHRLDHYERVLALRVEDPLEREQRRDLMLEVGRVAEAAGEHPRALEAYREALPRREAITAVARLEPDPYRLSNAYFQAGLHRRALEALGGLAAPSIEGPANRALGNHERALDAFRRWAAQVPGEFAALEGIAWSLFSLGRYAEADAAFAALPSGGHYGRGLVAGRRGEIARGAELLLSTGVASQMWLASTWLEGRGDVAATIDAYLRIARTGDRPTPTTPPTAPTCSRRGSATRTAPRWRVSSSPWARTSPCCSGSPWRCRARTSSSRWTNPR